MYIKSLIVITLGKAKIIRECMSVVREVFFRDFEGHGVRLSIVSGKLATRLMTACKAIKIDKKPGHWPYTVLSDDFTVEEAVGIIFNINHKIFTRFASEIIIILRKSRLFEIKPVHVGQKKVVSIIYLRQDGFRIIALATANPTDLPIICSPRAIKSDGIYKPYITDSANSYKFGNFEMIRRRNDLLYQRENIQAISETVNIMNKQRFVINIEILKFLIDEWYYEGQDNIFKGYNKPYSGPVETARDKKAQRAHNSVYRQNLLTLKIAWLYCDYVFYLPVYCDFRGRVYVISNYLSYQKGDLSRCLIGFYNDSDAITNTGMKEIYHHARNLRGNDKLPRDDRVELGITAVNNVIDKINKNDIRAVRKIIDEYPEPLQFITRVFTCIKISENSKMGKPRFVNQPILFDASCNGTQHLSALVNDTKLAQDVNVIVVNNSRGDFYESNMKMISEEVAKWQPKNENQKKVNIEKFKNIKVTRAMVKKPVITINYNISLEGIKDQIEDIFSVEWVENKPRFHVPAEYAIDGKEFYVRTHEIIALSVVMFNTLRAQPSIKVITEYLNRIATIMLKTNNKIRWVRPIGIVISRTYEKFKLSKTKSFVFSSRKPMSLRMRTGEVNVVKRKRAFLANLVHSLDARNIHVLVKLINEYGSHFPIYTIHDCFATTPNNMYKSLEPLVKRAFIQIYFSDEGFLTKIHNNIMKDLKNNFVLETIVDRNGNPMMKNGQVLQNIIIGKKKYEIPVLPSNLGNRDVHEFFIKNIKKRNYFIS